MRIVLVGFMGSGKTTLGKRLASRLNHPFLDLDAEIERVTRRTIPEIFSESGEPKFREIERNTLIDVLINDEYVLATGGGAPCQGDNMKIINEYADSIYLKISPEVLASRLISSNTERPLIEGKSPEELIEFIKSKLDEREVYYNQSKHTISGFNLNVDDILMLSDKSES
jgi:shikimate kinase